MKRKNLLIATSTIVLIALAWYAWQKNSTTSTLDRSKADFAIADTASISRIFMADKRSGRTFDLVRKGKREWYLNGTTKIAWPKADLLLATLHDLAIKRPVASTEVDASTKELATSHLKVEIYQQGSLTKTFYLGPEIDESKGNYAVLEGQNQPWVVYVPSFVGFPGARFAVDAVQWRDKGLFASTPQTVQRIEVRAPGQPGNDVVMTFKGKRFALEGAPVVDTGRIVSFVNAFRQIYVEEYVVDKHTADSIKTLNPTYTVQVEDIDKAKSHTVQFYGTPAELAAAARCFAYIKDLNAVITIQEQNYKPLLQRRQWFEKGQ